jgi:AraC-like DNA-binding protein
MSEQTAEYLQEHPLLRTRELDEAREIMGKHWDKHSVVPTTRLPFYTSVNHVALGELGLTFVRCSTPLEVTSSPTKEIYRLFLVADGHCEFDLNGKIAIAHSQTGVVVAAGQKVRMRSSEVRVLVLDVPYQLVEFGLVSRRLCDSKVACRAISFDCGTHPGIALKSLVQWTARQLDGKHFLSSSGGAFPELSHTLVSVLVDAITLRHQQHDDAKIGRLQLSDLEAYISAHLQKPLTADSLARIAGVSTRAVQAAFRRHRNCTPSQFVRLRRLEAVHHELENPRPGTDVSTVALNFGFFQQGDFARYYREQFGERPSETLRRAIRGTLPKSDSRHR